MDKAVVVLVGDWEYSAGGCWDFVIEKKCMAQCILNEDDTTYVALKQLIQKEFADDIEGVVGRLVYWLPSEMSVFSSGISPPVSITSDVGLKTFRKLRQETRGLNLFVTFKLPPERKDHTPDNSAAIITEDIIRLVDPTPDLETHTSGKDNSAAINGLGIDCGDVGETSMRQNVRCEEGLVIGTHNNSDDEILEHVQMVEAMLEKNKAILQNKGKEKVSVDCNWSGLDFETDEDTPYTTGDEADSNYDYLDSLLTSEYGKQCDGGLLERGYVSNQVEMAYCNEVGEASNPANTSVHPTLVEEGNHMTEDYVPETQEELVRDSRKGKAPMVEETELGAGQCVVEEYDADDEENIALQLSLDNIYNEILESDIMPSEDCAPCFGEDIVPTQALRYGEYDPRNDAIYIGRVFRNKQDMRTALGIYAVKRFFNFRQIKSDKERLIVGCVDNSCPWRVYGHVVGGTSENLQVRTATLTHTCDVTTRSSYGKKATARVIAEVLKSKYANGQVGPRAVDVPSIVLEELRVSVSYMRAWHAKERAVSEARGSAEDSYKLLLAYLHRLMQTNDGSVTQIERSGTEGGKIKFKYLFFSLGACIDGVKYMRKVIIIDATQIKSKYKGCLLTASFQDGNFQIFPLAFGVVNSENDESWSWFFRQLAEIIEDSEDLVFVSDKHASIYSALRAVYPRAAHGACAVHLYRNVKAKFRRAKGIPYLVTEAAAAYTVPEFKEKFAEIEKRSPECTSYLRGIGISHWARAYFQGKRYNISSSNVAESLNAALAKALEFPIVTMVESIRLMLMRWFYERRGESSRYQGRVTPEVDEILRTNLVNAGAYAVTPASRDIFQVSTETGVTFKVDLLHKSCTCRRFDILGFPCTHAMAAARDSGWDITFLVNDYYKTELWRHTYSRIVMPVPDSSEFELPPEVVNSDLLPPETRQAPGRPRKRRIPSVGENVIYKKGRTGPNRCNRCFQSGHNMATCKNGLP